MSWTYNADNVDSSTLMQVRLLIGDTDSSDEQLQDQEVQFFISTEANIYMAAHRCAQALVGTYARKVDKEMGDLKLLAAQRHRHYLRLSEQLKARGMVSGIPTAGGVSVSEKAALVADTDKVTPSFSRGLMDYT